MSKYRGADLWAGEDVVAIEALGDGKEWKLMVNGVVVANFGLGDWPQFVELVNKSDAFANMCRGKP